MRHGLHWSGSGRGHVVGFCECNNEPPDSTKCGEFLDWEPVSFSGRALLHGVSQPVIKLQGKKPLKWLTCSPKLNVQVDKPDRKYQPNALSTKECCPYNTVFWTVVLRTNPLHGLLRTQSQTIYRLNQGELKAFLSLCKNKFGCPTTY